MEGKKEVLIPAEDQAIATEQLTSFLFHQTFHFHQQRHERYWYIKDNTSSLQKYNTEKNNSNEKEKSKEKINDVYLSNYDVIVYLNNLNYLYEKRNKKNCIDYSRMQMEKNEILFSIRQDYIISNIRIIFLLSPYLFA